MPRASPSLGLETGIGILRVPGGGVQCAAVLVPQNFEPKTACPEVGIPPLFYPRLEVFRSHLAIRSHLHRLCTWESSSWRYSDRIDLQSYQVTDPIAGRHQSPRSPLLIFNHLWVSTQQGGQDPITPKAGSPSPGASTISCSKNLWGLLNAVPRPCSLSLKLSAPQNTGLSTVTDPVVSILPSWLCRWKTQWETDSCDHCQVSRQIVMEHRGGYL
jgi:hypothetical protein